jgi:hypothetical protein
MKPQAASGTAANGNIPASQLASEQGTERLPLDKDDEFFEDIPTVANRAHPSTEEGERREPCSPISGKHAGSYRILRPTTSDVVDAAIAQKAEATAAKRVVIGSTRKRR